MIQTSVWIMCSYLSLIHSFLLRILDEGVPSWHGKLMAREIVEPTNALGVVTRNSIQPLFSFLEKVLRDILRGKHGDHHFCCFCARSLTVGRGEISLKTTSRGD